MPGRPLPPRRLPWTVNTPVTLQSRRRKQDLVIDLIFGLISAGVTRLFIRWRDRARARGLSHGGKLSAPCALHIVDGDKARWQHGRATAEDDRVVWRSRTGKGRIVLHHGGVRLLTVRSPTDREGWFLRNDLVILRLRSDDSVFEVAMLPAEAGYFRTLLELPTD